MQNPAIYAKAIVAATGAATAGIGTAITDGVITGIEWIVIGLTTIGSAAAVYAWPNRDPEGVVQEQSVQPPERPLDGVHDRP